MRALRLALIPAVLTVFAVWCVGQAKEADRDPAPPSPIEARSASTPLLSARRLPDLVSRPVARRTLAAKLDEFVAGNPSGTCISVTEAGTPIYGARPDEPMVPASTEKLITAHAALTAIDPGTTLETRVVAETEPRAGRIAGDLYLVGGGDPLLSTGEYVARSAHPEQAFTDLGSLADAVVAAGVQSIQGVVVGDESRYDDLRFVPTWPSRFVSQSQAGPLSALSVNDGFVDDDGILRRSAAPAATAADTFERLLRERGVSVGTNERTGAAPEDATTIAALPSLPIEDIVGQMLTYSDNTTAELLTKELGLRYEGSGSTSAGSVAIGETLSSASLDRAERTTTDGSGLDDSNHVTCDLLVDVLDEHGPDGALAAGLPVAGESGTLADRFQSSPAEGLVSAKTGTLRDVTALAGFVEVPDSGTLTFSVLVNTTDGALVDGGIVERQEQVPELLLSWPEVPERSVLVPR